MSAPTNPNDRDYLDKGLDAAQKKYGGQRFADPNKNRAMNEKITDFIRKQFEKITGRSLATRSFLTSSPHHHICYPSLSRHPLPDTSECDMVRSRSPPPLENVMGQTSSQLGPPEGEGCGATMAETRKSKEKRSKTKKSKRKSAVEQLRLDEEQESARALMQLAQGSVEHTRAPYYENNQQASIHPESDSSQHLYGPEMTSQEIIARMSQDYSSDGKAKKKGKKERKKRARKEVIEALDGLEVNRTTEVPPQEQLDLPPGQGNDASPIDMGLSRPRSLQALDDSSTGDEVDEYQELNQLPQTAKDAIQTSKHPSRNPLENSEDNFLGLPEYSTSQRLRGIDEATARVRISKHKRKRAGGGSTNATDAADRTRLSVTQPADLHLPQKSGKDFADLIWQMQDSEMLIDPVLHSMNPQPPSAERPDTQGTGAEPALIDRLNSTKPRKRRRVDELLEDVSADRAGDEEVPYYSPYASHEHLGGSQDLALLDRDNAHQQGFPGLDSTFIAEPDRNGQVNLNNSDLTNHQYGYQATGGADVNWENGNRGDARSSRKPKTSNNKDHFGPAELMKLEAFRDSYCEANNKTHREFNEIIQSKIRGKPQAVQLFKQLQELFPMHRHSYIQRFCRRKFHNFSARGTWTPEEDDMLRQAVAERGTAWKAVGEMIDRFPEDCRDRYRNYLANAGHRNREQWTEGEILNLAGAILDCMQMMKAERYRQKQEKYGYGVPMSDDEEEQDKADMKLVNWQAVSDRMGAYGGGRSRLQCSLKWGKIKETEQRRYLREAKESRQGLDAFQTPNDNFTKSGGWRMRQASKKVRNMLPADRYDLLHTILQCGAPTEGNIPWRSMGEEWWQQRWTTTERKAGWLMMKKELPGSEDMNYRDVVYTLLTPLMQQDLSQRWDLTGYDPRKRLETRRKKKKKKTPNSDATAPKRKNNNNNRRAEEAIMRRQEKDLARGLKSREFVHDSSEEEDDDEDEEEEEHRDDPSRTRRAGEARLAPAMDGPSDYSCFDPQLTPGRKWPSSRRGEAGAGDNTETVRSGNSMLYNGAQHVPDADLSAELAGKVLALQHAT
ncbi:MAG: hypothetical protein Q9163_004185 [Psora crenata]